MANLTTIARPYAKAIMLLAKGQNNYAQWSKMLGFLSMLVVNEHVDKLLHNLAVPAASKAKLLNSIDPMMLDQQGQNLVKTLAYYKRLLIIPALYELYEKLRKLEQQEVTVRLFVARELSEQELAQLRTDFAAELGAHLNLQQEFVPGLIGGGKVKIGDRVIDSSIKSNLQELYKHLTAEQGHLT